MKVLHAGKFYPPRWGGMETALKDICETVAGEIEVQAIVANESSEDVAEDIAGVAVHRLPNWTTLFSQPLTPGLLGEFQRTDADIVHIHEPNPLAVACFLASGCRSKLVIHYHSDIVRQHRLAKLYRPLQEEAMRRAELIIAGSRELVESSPVLQRWQSKCRVVPFGIDLNPFLEHELGPPTTGEPIVLAVGRLSYYKGFHYLIEAMAEAPGKLVIVGEGGERSALEALIVRLGLSDRVQLAGKIELDQLVSWYHRADIFCLSSCERSEAFGLVQLEAMAAGLPLITTDLPTGVRAINRHEETGLVVPPHDSGALAAAIHRLAGDSELRARLGRAARQRAVEFFSRELMGQNILALYRAVAGEGDWGRGESPAAMPDREVAR